MSDDLSLESKLALLDPEVRSELLEGLDLGALLYDWRYYGRPSQIAACTDLNPVVLFSAGRGSGKTLAGSEWIRDKVSGPKPVRIALVARTAADVRDTMVQGESGLMRVFPPSQEPRYIPTARRIEFANGSVGLCFSAEEPGQLRGPQFHYSWGDELAAWLFKPDDSGLTAWDNLRIATRLGTHPQVFATTTPRRVRAIRELYRMAEEGRGVGLHTATTYDNPHLSAVYFEVVRGLYEGTRLGAQELRAMLLDDAEGALWTTAAIDADRIVAIDPASLPLRVVGVDPSVADDPQDECGIVVCGATSDTRPTDRTAYVLADRSILGPPSEWARRAAEVAREFDAPIVAESNQGGALVREAIHSFDRNVQVRLVNAKQGKALRAEPVTLAYDRHRVRHVGELAMLEDQMTTWVPGETAKSPDRVDALVHALTALVVPSAVKSGIGTTSVRANRGRIPTGAMAGARSAW